MNLVPAHLDGDTLTRREGQHRADCREVDRARRGRSPGDRARVSAVRPRRDIPARLYLLENLGETKLLNLKLGEVLVRMRVAQSEAIPDAETIPVAFEPSAIHLFDAETGRRVEAD